MYDLYDYEVLFDRIACECGDGGDIFGVFVHTLRDEHLGNSELLWTDGDRLYTPHEDVAQAVAGWFDSMGYIALTGYYDPAEDRACDTVDCCTGNWYIDVE